MSRNRQPFAPRANRRRSRSAGLLRAPRSALRARKGVILLVILALLALFTLLGLTLVMATAQARRNALAAARANAQAVRDDSSMDEVFNQIARGSNDLNSVLSVHSLLEDLYGSPLLLGLVSSAPAPMDPVAAAVPNMLGECFSMQVQAVPGNNIVYNNLIPASGEYCGLVITMLNGPAQGRSSRVVGHAYNSGTLTTTLQVAAFDGLVPNLGDQFLINGRPFSGTGFGFDPGVIKTTPIVTPTPLLAAADPTGAGSPVPWYYALLPNPAAFTPGGGTSPLFPYIDAAGPGGPNESYDLPDFQNMILAMHYYDANGGSPTLGTVVTPLPSLHRPDLIQFWMNAYGIPPTGAGGTYSPADWTIFANTLPALARKICLRPLLADHPAFTGSNPSAGGFDPIQPAIPGSPFLWDVDNDGDGVPDSIWADVGLDAQIASDGTKYKLLAAILCVDMDGKININANGMLSQLDPNRYGGNVYGPFAGPAATGPTGAVATGTAGARLLTTGQGMGPWETNPLYLVMRNSVLNGLPMPPSAPPNAQTQALNDLLYLWQGFAHDPNPGVVPPIYYDGRYGESQRPDLLVPTDNPSAPGFASTIWQRILGGPRPGVSRWYDVGTFQPHDPFALAREMGVRPYLLAPSFGLNAPGTFFDYILPSFSATLHPFGGPAAHVPTSFGSPYDYHGRGVTGVDIAGHVYYGGSPFYVGSPAPNPPYLNPPFHNSFTEVQQDPSAGLLALNDMPDNPAELDLSPNAQHDGWIDPATSLRVTKDQPFGADELSHILRPNDLDMQNSPSRLKHLANLSGPNAAWPLQPSQSWSITTDSRHLPVPDSVPADFAATYAGQQDMMTFSTVTGRPLRYNGLSIVDLIRARIVAENGAPPPLGAGNGAYVLANSPDLALFGNVNGNAAATAPGVFGVWPLLAPELIQGLKLDINRLLGNGADDNGNGVVDEPAESLSGEGATFPNLLGTIVTLPVDHNNDGLYPATDGTTADFRARQLLARQLYVLMMLLVDDRYLQASIFNTTVLAPVWPRPMSQRLPSTLTPQEQAAYVIAQWAINAVDFRDADSIMTPFEFDLHPFFDDDGNALNGTWDVDDVVFPASGAVFPANSQATAADDVNPWRGLVFGAERPALLLTETLATHDRGTDNTSIAMNLQSPPNATMGPDTVTNPITPATPSDSDWDQVRRPRGSLMVELFNPAGFMDAPRNDLLYDAALATQPWMPSVPFPAGLTGVNVGQTTYAGGKASSVWRLAVVYSPMGYDTGYTGVPTPILDPRVPVLNPTAVHRVAYLGTNVTAANDMVGAAGSANPLVEVPINRSFYVDQSITGVTTPLIVPPDSYAMVGPGTMDPTTSTVGMYVGARPKGARIVTLGAGPGNVNSNPLHMVLWGAPGVINAAGVGVGPYAAPGLNVKAVLGVPLATNMYTVTANTATPASGILGQGAAAQASAIWSLRFSLSEPESGYKVWQGPSPLYGEDDQFFYQDKPVAGTLWPNMPWDKPASTGVLNNGNTGQSTPNPNVAPDGANPVKTLGGYTTVYLQRLANPLAAWDAYANPYVTVDSMDVSLTSYTGEYSGSDVGLSATPTGIEPSYGAGGGGGMAAFDNLRRGQVPGPDAPNVWIPLPSAISGTQPTPAGGTITAPLPNQSFGYLNPGYYAGAAVNNPLAWAAGMYNAANVSLLTATGTAGISPGSYYGDPMTPFPWLAWNDRPYVSHYELMLVPASGPSALLGDVGLLGWAGGGTASNQYQVAVQQMPLGPLPPGSLPFAQFQHLMNFFDDTTPAPLGVPIPGKSDIARLYRALDYIAVPSRFAGTQEMLNPTAFAANANPFVATPGSSPAWAQLHPPFNWLNQYREPGRVNLNTTFDPQVFQGVMDDYPGWGTLWNNLVASRRGYGGAGGLLYQANTVYPTIFANPFRAAGASALVPPSGAVGTPAYYGMMHVNNAALPTGLQDVNSTLLRAAGSSPGGILGGNVAMFDANGFDSTNTTANLVYNSGTVPSRESGRNPSFAYAPETRLGNLTTNHSNVYAIWITLGKFTVTQGQINAQHPDGYYLGPELLDISGNQVRSRAFYIFDRSIPVGFIRGENLNMEKGVLINAVIQ